MEDEFGTICVSTFALAVVPSVLLSRSRPKPDFLAGAGAGAGEKAPAPAPGCCCLAQEYCGGKVATP